MGTAGADPGGGGVLGVRTPPPLFGGPPNFIKRGEKRCVWARKYTIILVLYSYPNSPTPFPQSCIRLWNPLSRAHLVPGYTDLPTRVCTSGVMSAGPDLSYL